MIKRNILSAFLFFSVITSYVVNAQPVGEPLILEGATVHKIQSDIVIDQIYELQVSLPDSYYDSPEKEYPVIFVLDGQWNFTLVSNIAGKLAFDGMMPEVITVGITWGGEGDVPDILRTRDFVRPEAPFLPAGGGGASLFLSALTEELVPYIENEYRVEDRRALLGSSLGGLFTSYAMVEKPGFFDGYLAIAGSYIFDTAYLDEKFELLSGTKALNGVRSFLGVGALDANQAFVDPLNDTIRSVRLKGFRNQYKVFKSVGHAGVEPIAYTYGLQFIFKRPALKLDKSILQRYVGEYEGGAEGQPPFVVGISISDNGLLTFVLPQITIEYLAESESKFYDDGFDGNLEFFDDGTFVGNSRETVFRFSRIE